MKFHVNFVCVLVVHFAMLIALAEQDSCVDNSNCKATNGNICNRHGTCDCGVCQCDGLYSGPTCEECPTCPAPCQTFQDCVRCKIFGTGPISVMDCISQCDNFANYVPVENEDFLDMSGEDRYLCNYINAEFCMESFRIGNMSNDLRNIYVRSDTDCKKYAPTSQPTVRETSRQKDKKEMMMTYQQAVEDNATKDGVDASKFSNIAKYDEDEDEYASDVSDTVLGNSDSASGNAFANNGPDVLIVLIALAVGLTINNRKSQLLGI